MNTTNTDFEDFPYDASQLSAFGQCMDTFIITLKNTRMIHYKTAHVEQFRNWLAANNIRDINDSLTDTTYYARTQNQKRSKRQLSLPG